MNYIVTALSVERFIEVTDTKKKTSDKYKLFLTIFCLALIWLGALLISLPIVLSFESIIAHNSSKSCQTTWTDLQISIYSIVTYIFIFIVPFTIILVSSVRLLKFLIEWQKKMSTNKNTFGTANNTKLKVLNTCTCFYY